MLVLLDACHSGAVTGTGATLTSDADKLRTRVLSQQHDGADVLNQQRNFPRRR